MKRYRLVLMIAVAVAAGACGSDGLCGEGAGESSVELDASALASPGSRLEVCINDLCNSEDDFSARVSVSYSPGVHPDFARWSVQRVTGSSWEGLAGGEVGLSCSGEPSAVRIVVDATGNETVSSGLLFDPLL